MILLKAMAGLTLGALFLIICQRQSLGATVTTLSAAPAPRFPKPIRDQRNEPENHGGLGRWRHIFYLGTPSGLKRSNGGVSDNTGSQKNQEICWL